MSIAVFVTGLIVGTLLGLALAPVLQAWVAWRVVHEARSARGPNRLLTRFLSRV